MEQRWLKYKLFVFDLDDTLYCEKDYLFAAYNRIAESVTSDVALRDTYSRYLKETFVREGRTDLFQKFRKRFNLSMSEDKMVDMLHHTDCRLSLNEALCAQIDELLLQNKEIAVLTNGHVAQQQQKVANLQLLERFPSIEVCYASLIAPKPSPKALQAMMARRNILAEETLLVGDSETDRETAMNAGVAFWKYQI